jgi:hypothetical protein
MTFQESWYHDTLKEWCLSIYGQKPRSVFPFAETVYFSESDESELDAFNNENLKQLIYADVLVTSDRGPGSAFNSTMLFRVVDSTTAALFNSAWIDTGVEVLSAAGVVEKGYAKNLHGIWLNHITGTPDGVETYISMTGYRFTF